MTGSQRLFFRTRLRLTVVYTSVIGIVVFLAELSLYSCVRVMQNQTFDRNLEQLVGTVHDYLSSQLEQPGVVQPQVRNLLTGTGVNRINLLGIVRQQEYYVRLLNLQGDMIALSNFQPSKKMPTGSAQDWQIFTATDGVRYRQVNVYQHNRSGQAWGYLQLGRSMEELENDQRHLNWFLGLSVPLSMLVAGGVGYWFAGLAMRPIYRSYQQMEQFTADAAHELRTPLTTTRTLVQTLLNKLQNGKPIDLEPLEAIERQNDRMNQLVADLLLLARADLVKLPKFQLCYLNEIILDLVEELVPMAHAAKIELNAKLENNVPICVLGSEEQLYRLLINLIVNGIQYTPVNGKVTINLKQSHTAAAVIEVEDTGIGIPIGEQQKVFDRFYRVDASRSRHTGGTGLGLAICLAIVQIHRGTIQIQSQPNYGSKFIVTLPKYTSSQQSPKPEI